MQKTSKLEKLSTLVTLLSQEEIKFLSKKRAKAKSVKSQLINSLLKKNTKNTIAISKPLAQPKINQLAQEVYIEFLDQLAGVSVNIPDSYTEKGWAMIRLRRNFAHAQYLASKNLFPQVIDIHNKTIREAKKYELYDYLLLSLYDLGNLYSAFMYVDLFEKNKKEINKYEQLRKAVNKAFVIFNTQGMVYAKHDIIQKDNPILLDSILTLKNLYDETQAPIIKWYYYRSLLQFYEITQQELTAYTVCIELIEFQKKNASVNSSTSMAISYKLMAKFSLAYYLYDDALSYSQMALEMERIPFNRDLILNIKFQIEFIKSDYSAAKKTLLQISSTFSKFYTSRLAYFQACLSMVLEEKNEVNRILLDTKEIEKDKEGWNINIRILWIMNSIERKEYELANSQIESLRKHIERTQKEFPVRQRLLVIFESLRELSKFSFQFKNIPPKLEENLNLLKSTTDDTYSWSMFSAELIRFDVWFESKLRKLPYQVVFNERIENEKLNNPM